MKRFKILIATTLIVVAIITATSVSFAAWIFTKDAQQTVEVDSGEWDATSTNTYNLEYKEIYDDNIRITEYKVVGFKSEMVGSIVRIPATHNGLPVTTIGSSFCQTEKIQLFKLIIPASITTIEADSLSYLNMLSTLIIEGNGLVTIGDRALSNCNSLIDVVLTSSLTVIGENVLANCINLNKIEVLTQKSKINNGTNIINFGLKSDSSLPEIIFTKEAA